MLFLQRDIINLLPMKRSRNLEKIAKVLSGFSWLKPIGSPIWRKLYTEPLENKRRKKFLENGLTLLTHFDEVMQRANIPYSLVFGTLLGAVRDNGFIKHDLDIDVAVWGDSDAHQIEKVLINSGFQLYKRIEVDNGVFGREETYIYNGVSIDLFYFYDFDNDLKYTTVFVPFDDCKTFDDSLKRYGGLLPIQLILPLDVQVRYIPFLGINVPIPINAIEFLVARYGENWRIPDPTFVYPKMGDARVEYRRDKIGRIVFENSQIIL